MREVRVPVTEVRPGEIIVKLGTREINARFIELAHKPHGTKVTGPRGGQYRVLGGAFVVVVTSTGRPVVRRDSFATVLRDAE